MTTSAKYFFLLEVFFQSYSFASIVRVLGWYSDVVRELVQAGADLAPAPVIGWPALVVACDGGHVDAVRHLLEVTFCKYDIGSLIRNIHRPRFSLTFFCLLK